MKKLYVSVLAALLATAVSAAAPAEATKAAEPVKAEVAKAAEPAKATKVEAAKPADAKKEPAVAAPHKDEAAAHKGGKKRGRHGNTCALADMLNGDVKVWHMPTAEELKAENCKKACHKADHKDAHKAEKKKDSAVDVKKAPEAAVVAGDKKPAATEGEDAEGNNEA